MHCRQQIFDAVVTVKYSLLDCHSAIFDEDVNKSKKTKQKKRPLSTCLEWETRKVRGQGRPTFCDGCSECCLSMINMTNCTNIHMRFVSKKSFFLCHWLCKVPWGKWNPPYILEKNKTFNINVKMTLQVNNWSSYRQPTGSQLVIVIHIWKLKTFK